MWASRPEVPVGGDLVGLRRQAAGELPGACPTQPDESARGPDAGRRGTGRARKQAGKPHSHVPTSWQNQESVRLQRLRLEPPGL